MNDADVRTTLGAALLLDIAEGWYPVAALDARYERPARRRALLWLRVHGFVEMAGDVCRWLPQRTFEEAWSALVPDRPCPERFRQVDQREVVGHER